MVIISTRADEVIIQALSPESILGGAGAAAAGAAAGAAAAGAELEAGAADAGAAEAAGAALDAGAELWANAGAAKGPPTIKAASRRLASRFNPSLCIRDIPMSR
jgi:hypothetical protein